MRTSPHSSVRQVRTPACRNIESVEGHGWPKSLPAPTLMTASVGCHTLSDPWVRPLSLP